MTGSVTAAFDELRRSGRGQVLLESFIDDSPDNSKGATFLATRYEGAVAELRAALGDPSHQGPEHAPLSDGVACAWWPLGARWATVFVTAHDAGSLLNLWIELTDRGPAARPSTAQG
jgi:hypothetical protein